MVHVDTLLKDPVSGPEVSRVMGIVRRGLSELYQSAVESKGYLRATLNACFLLSSYEINQNLRMR